jgi:hypothetical protein
MMRAAVRVNPTRISALVVPLTLVAGVWSTAPAAGRGGQEERKSRPSLSLRANPVVAFAPAEILFVGELRGGANDYEEFYCATVEWDWDDDTKSEMTEDCEPYEPGKSEIRRRFTMRHKFEYSGAYEVRLHLKNRDKVLTFARVHVEVRGGTPRF